MEMDHYEASTLLGLDIHKHLTKSEIDHAYRSASLASHPDREGGSNEQFQAVAQAKETLLFEIETGKRITEETSSFNNETTPTRKHWSTSHCWAGEKYDTPSTQSPLSPLRQMGQPVDLTTMSSNEITDLWNKRQLHCVWRCSLCDAVCCRVRREKFRCVCGHQLRDHDPSNGFSCNCQAKKVSHSSAVHKGRCKCKKTAKCICKHSHDMHDPETLLCRACGDDLEEHCQGWNPTFQCHCGHSCENHTTSFVKGSLSKGHRDWVVSGVRLETARIAEKFRDRPVEEQILRRAAVGLSDAQKSMFFQLFMKKNAKSKTGMNMPHQPSSTNEQNQQQHQNNDNDDKASTTTPQNSESLHKYDCCSHENVKEEEEDMNKEKILDSTTKPIEVKLNYNSNNVFIRNQLEAQTRIKKKEILKEKIAYQESLKTTFSPRTNHKSSIKKIRKNRIERTTSDDSQCQNKSEKNVENSSVATLASPSSSLSSSTSTSPRTSSSSTSSMSLSSPSSPNLSRDQYRINIDALFSQARPITQQHATSNNKQKDIKGQDNKQKDIKGQDNKQKDIKGQDNMSPKHPSKKKIKKIKSPQVTRVVVKKDDSLKCRTTKKSMSYLDLIATIHTTSSSSSTFHSGESFIGENGQEVINQDDGIEQNVSGDIREEGEKVDAFDEGVVQDNNSDTVYSELEEDQEERGPGDVIVEVVAAEAEPIVIHNNNNFSTVLRTTIGDWLIENNLEDLSETLITTAGADEIDDLLLLDEEDLAELRLSDCQKQRFRKAVSCL